MGSYNSRHLGFQEQIALNSETFSYESDCYKVFFIIDYSFPYKNNNFVCDLIFSLSKRVPQMRPVLGYQNAAHHANPHHAVNKTGTEMYLSDTRRQHIKH